jgi:hypothetical protein
VAKFPQPHMIPLRLTNRGDPVEIMVPVDIADAADIEDARAAALKRMTAMDKTANWEVVV